MSGNGIEKPVSSLETPHLILKSIGYDDADFFFREFSIVEVNRYLYDAEPCENAQQAMERIDFYLQGEPRNQHRWVILLKENRKKIGTCGFHCWNRNRGEAEIGYYLQPLYWRKGIMTEALKEVLRLAHESMKLNTLYAHFSTENIASRKTAEKLGFVKTETRYWKEFHGNKYPHDVYECRLRKDS